MIGTESFEQIESPSCTIGTKGTPTKPPDPSPWEDGDVSPDEVPCGVSYLSPKHPNITNRKWHSKLRRDACRQGSVGSSVECADLWLGQSTQDDPSGSPVTGSPSSRSPRLRSPGSRSPRLGSPGSRSPMPGSPGSRSSSYDVQTSVCHSSGYHSHLHNVQSEVDIWGRDLGRSDPCDDPNPDPVCYDPSCNDPEQKIDLSLEGCSDSLSNIGLRGNSQTTESSRSTQTLTPDCGIKSSYNHGSTKTTKTSDVDSAFDDLVSSLNDLHITPLSQVYPRLEENEGSANCIESALPAVFSFKSHTPTTVPIFSLNAHSEFHQTKSDTNDLFGFPDVITPCLNHWANDQTNNVAHIPSAPLFPSTLGQLCENWCSFNFENGSFGNSGKLHCQDRNVQLGTTQVKNLITGLPRETGSARGTETMSSSLETTGMETTPVTMETDTTCMETTSTCMEIEGPPMSIEAIKMPLEEHPRNGDSLARTSPSEDGIETSKTAEDQPSHTPSHQCGDSQTDNHNTCGQTPSLQQQIITRSKTRHSKRRTENQTNDDEDVRVVIVDPDITRDAYGRSSDESLSDDDWQRCCMRRVRSPDKPQIVNVGATSGNNDVTEESQMPRREGQRSQRSAGNRRTSSALLAEAQRTLCPRPTSPRATYRQMVGETAEVLKTAIHFRRTSRAHRRSDVDQVIESQKQTLEAVLDRRSTMVDGGVFGGGGGVEGYGEQVPYWVYVLTLVVTLPFLLYWIIFL